MKNLSIENILSAVKGKYLGDEKLLGKKISFVTTDSRKAGEGCLFAAIKGERSDGHDYIEKALEMGALCAIGEKAPKKSGLPVILVKNTIEALGDLAGFYREQLQIPILGITGSVGKTTAKEMCATVLSQRFKLHKTDKNLNNELGVPLTLFGIEEDHELAVVEMGISHFGEMGRLGEIVCPDMALYTAIGAAHLEFLGDYEGILRAKSEMLEFLPPEGKVFINGDDETLKKLQSDREIISFGLSADCQVKGENIVHESLRGTSFDIVSGSRRIPVRINAYGTHLISAALGAATVAMSLGLKDEEIAKGISEYAPVGSRSAAVQTDKITIIDDCYNANPSSVCSAIDSLAGLSGRLVCILGDMGELGADETKLHYKVGSYGAKKGIHRLIACGKLSKNTAEGARAAGCPEVFYFENKEALKKELSALIAEGDKVLVKASHSQAFEEIVGWLKEL
jgi:UDP-N-acetylmuramoyl-tripeptide--D-alanyl-D-alanine ligase